MSIHLKEIPTELSVKIGIDTIIVGDFNTHFQNWRDVEFRE